MKDQRKGLVLLTMFSLGASKAMLISPFQESNLTLNEMKCFEKARVYFVDAHQTQYCEKNKANMIDIFPNTALHLDADYTIKAMVGRLSLWPNQKKQIYASIVRVLDQRSLPQCIARIKRSSGILDFVKLSHIEKDACSKKYLW